jgi:hypothetical protein
MKKYFPLLWPHPTPGGHDFKKTLIYGVSGSFNITYNFPDPVVFKDISYIKFVKNSFPYCGPT